MSVLYPFGCREKWSNISRETYTTKTTVDDSRDRDRHDGTTARRSGQSFDDSFYKDWNDFFLRSSPFDDMFNMKSSLLSRKTTENRFNNKNKFVIHINVKEFSFEEIEVKIVDQNLIINCKHNEKRDENNGWITRDITRRYELPSDVDIDSVKSSLNERNGVLTVQLNRFSDHNINIPVIHEKSNTNHKPILQAMNSVDSSIDSTATSTKSFRQFSSTPKPIVQTMNSVDSSIDSTATSTKSFHQSSSTPKPIVQAMNSVDSTTTTTTKTLRQPIIQTINSVDSTFDSAFDSTATSSIKSFRQRKNSDNNFEIIDTYDPNSDSFEASV